MGGCMARHANTNAATSRTMGSTTHTISVTRCGDGTLTFSPSGVEVFALPATTPAGVTLKTARRMNICAMAHSTTATQKIASVSDVDMNWFGKNESYTRTGTQAKARHCDGARRSGGVVI